MVKAAVVSGTGAQVEIGDLELPPPGPGDVRVRIAAAGVCHSDLSFVNGTLSPRFPVVLGHEAAGTVAETGADVTRVAVGDRVVINWAPACRECWFCEHGEPSLCTAAEGVTTVERGTYADGSPANLCLGVGAFAEEVVVPERGVIPLADGVPMELAALLGCAVLTGIGAVRNSARVKPGESVVVLGAGGIGLSAVAGAKLAGAATVIAVDTAAEKEALARAMGATDFVLAGDGPVHKQVRALTDGRGADHAFECIGRASTIRAAWQSTRRGGRATVVGVGRRDDTLTFNALELFHFARTLSGSIYGSGDPDVDVPTLAEEVRRGTLDLTPLVTHRIGLDGINEAFARMDSGVGARSVVLL